MAIATAIALVILRVWNGSFSVPWRLGGDADFYLMITDAIVKHGWYLTNPKLAAPYGQDLYDLPHGLDNLQFVIIKVIGWLTGGNVVATVNVYFVLTFTLIAGAMFTCLRVIGATRVTAIVVGVLYALMPYHFVRGTNHLLLSGYYMVPFGILLALLVVGANPPFTRVDSGWLPRLGDKSWLVVLACVGVASTGAYYAIFTVVLLVCVTVAVFIARRERRIVVSAATMVAIIGVTMALNLAPTFVYWMANGTNAEVAQRTPQEAENNGLRISELITPRESHRVAALRVFDEQIDEFKNRSEDGMPLGAVGSIGFLGLIVGAVVVLATRSRKEPSDPELAATLRHLSTLNLVACLVATMGGFSLLLAAAGLREIRAWNRISIVIGALALMAFALVWDRVVRRRVPTVIAVTLVIAIGAFGVWDQTSGSDAPAHAGNAQLWNGTTKFVRQIETEVGAGAMIFQAPYVAFPESKGVFNLGSYDGARLSLLSDNLRWSFGAVVGRQDEWAKNVAALPPAAQLDELEDRGFAGVVVDRYGYADEIGADEYIHELSRLTGSDIINSPNNRYAFIAAP